VFIYAILFYFVSRSKRLYRQSEDLLRNILPDEVANRLKHSQEMIADRYESASILFADVAGFTPMSAELTPEELINLLNEVFTSFDDLVVERGLEKIKTIGDAYMVAAGVPVARDDHALAICDLALAMQEHLESRTFFGRRLQMRIGIASGPVMAGIIGRQKFSYDLWGDTVNMASRMENTGTPGRIQLTATTCELVRQRYHCEERGLVDVKGKGPTQTWYLVGR
jgi:adenylate cyclase